MTDQPAYFTIQAKVRHADWPGGRALCSVLSAPEYFEDQWFVSNAETGRTDVLEVFRFGMLRR
jgi:hypothetical protein